MTAPQRTQNIYNDVLEEMHFLTLQGKQEDLLSHENVLKVFELFGNNKELTAEYLRENIITARTQGYHQK